MARKKSSRDIRFDAKGRRRLAKSGQPLINDDMEKLCPRCNTYKPLGKFSISKASVDGHGAFCFVCNRNDWVANGDYRGSSSGQQFRRRQALAGLPDGAEDEARRRQWFGVSVWWAADSTSDGLVGEIIGATPDGRNVWVLLDGRTPYRRLNDDTEMPRPISQYTMLLWRDAVRAMTPAQVDDFWQRWKHKRRERVAYWRRVAANEERMHDQL